MEPFVKPDDIITLPSGRSFKFKNFYDYYDDKELNDIIAKSSSMDHILSVLKINNIYHYHINHQTTSNSLSK